MEHRIIQQRKRCHESLQLESFLSQCPMGAVLTYEDIAQATAVQMDERGKGLLRGALSRLGLEYLCMRQKGIELGSPHTTVKIMEGRFVQVDARVRRAEVSHTRLERFTPALSADDKRAMEFIGRTFGAIRVATDHFRARALRQGERLALIPPPVHGGE